MRLTRVHLLLPHLMDIREASVAAPAREVRHESRVLAHQKSLLDQTFMVLCGDVSQKRADELALQVLAHWRKRPNVLQQDLQRARHLFRE